MPELTPEEQAVADAAAKATADAATKKIKFDQEQTEFVNSLFSTAFKEGAERAETRLKTDLEKQKADFEKQKADYEAQLATLKKPKDEPKEPKATPEYQALDARVKEMQDILTGIKTERDTLRTQVESAEVDRRKGRKKDEFFKAVADSKLDFYNQTEAYELAEKDGYDWDPSSDKPVVKNLATGVAKLNENGEPMSPLDYVKDFAKRKNYLVKAPQSDGGTGSGENRKNEPNLARTPNFATMTKEEFETFRQSVLTKNAR